MRYILEGRDADKVIQENRIRANRGDVKFTPLSADAEIPAEGFGSFDTKDAPMADTKEPATSTKKTTRRKNE